MVSQAAVREQLAGLLRTWDFHVLVAADGATASAYLDALPRPSLLIVEHVPPAIDAQVLLASLDRRADRAQLGAVVITSDPRGLGSRPLKGVRATLRPPLDPDELEQVVNAWTSELVDAAP